MRNSTSLHFCSDQSHHRRCHGELCFLGDVIIAEPKSMIGFAGPRVIRETTPQDLPERFQTAEFLQEHGLIDMIVHRKKMREQLSQLLGYFSVVP